jgi:hypothetical protein
MGSQNAHRKTQAVTDWLNGLEANFYYEGIVWLMQHLDECLNRDAGHAEK